MLNREYSEMISDPACFLVVFRIPQPQCAELVLPGHGIIFSYDLCNTCFVYFSHGSPGSGLGHRIPGVIELLWPSILSTHTQSQSQEMAGTWGSDGRQYGIDWDGSVRAI